LRIFFKLIFNEGSKNLILKKLFRENNLGDQKNLILKNFLGKIIWGIKKSDFKKLFGENIFEDIF